VNLIDRDLETLQTQLEEEKKQLLTDEGLCEDIIDSARIKSQSIGALLSITRMIEVSTREYTPQHAVMFVHRLIDGLNLRAAFFLNPIPGLNFSYFNISRFLDRVSRALGEAERVSETKIVILSFPQTHQSDPIIHSLLAHEIGHWINDERKIVENVFARMVPITLGREQVEFIRADIQRRIGAGRIVRESDIMSEFVEQVQKWLAEVASDLVGTRLLGPAFVFTLANLLSRIQDPDACSSDYPSTRMRAKIQIEELERHKYGEMLAGLASQTSLKESGGELSNHYIALKQFASSNSQLPPAMASHLDSMVFDLLQGHLLDLKREVDLILGELGFSSAMFREDVPRLVSQLAALVPPCEIKIGEPASVASIVNSGLVFMETSAIEKVRNLLKDDVIDARQNVNALTFKAIELSTIERDMEKSD
jgi:hypothetical protein